MKRLFGIALILGVILLAMGSYFYYTWFQRPCVFVKDDTNPSLYIQEDLDMKGFSNLIRTEKRIKNNDDLELYAVIRGIKKVKSGHYILKDGMSCNQLMNMLSAGLQTPVRVPITPSRLPEDLAGKMAEHLALDSSQILHALMDEKIANSYGFSTKDFFTMFIPDSYDIYWNSSIERLLDRMKLEYDKFWNEERIAKANNINLDPKEVVVLASIVYSEQKQFSDERSKIAGLYLNRLRINMPLQSDPTLIFASGDFTKKRVLNADKKIDSPYNTYEHLGLPPGPIYSPDKRSIESVLNPEKNNYLYMCAKEDFSGYHAFATNLTEHNNNARRYQRALNKKRIFR